MTPNFSLAGRHALVGGASQGIGRACALTLAAQGAQLTLLARRREVLEQLLQELPAPATGEHAILVADLADPDALPGLLAPRVNAAPVHVLVHNGGGPPPGLAHQADADAYRRAFEAHLIAGQALLQACLPGMRAAGYGRLINIISTSVKEPIRGLGVSNTIRWAVASWAKTLSVELAADGITVNNVLPGFTRTERLASLIAGRVRDDVDTATVERQMLASVPAGRFAEAAEIAAAVCFLASPAASYINGVNLPVDGGRTQSL
ncbi:MAG: SDR family oxidoreductase [Xanthomonadales bacterium]|nr:SDR family oxidoreductase [Xanthomonadales bacterium]